MKSGATTGSSTERKVLTRTLAQLVERHAYTVNVGGSNPSRPTKYWVAGIMALHRSPKPQIGVRFPGDPPRQYAKIF